MIFSLKGKTVYVCGGSGLIGRKTVEALSDAGAKTIVLDVTKTGKKFEHFDVTDLERIEFNLRVIFKKHGGPHVWINLSYPRTKDWGQAFEKLDVQSVRRNIDMQLTSNLWSGRFVALYMKEKKIKGSIIHCGSIYGVQANDFTVYEGTDIHSPYAYSAIKAGVINSTRFLASYFGKDNIRANTVCPGGIFDNQNKRFVKNYEQKVPLKRMARPEEMASVIHFLASDASSYVTGATVMVDGGWTVV
jgi:NAD(P)-dependent dehydrogenase (short-subunit alcohol dehydrogenase family)